MDTKPSCSGREHSNSKLRILLLGFKETGKSSAGNTLLGNDEFDLKERAECERKQGMVSGRQIIVIETPGRRMYTASVTPKLCQQEAIRSVTLCPPGPHALLLVLKITSSLQGASRETVTGYLTPFGETIWKHTMVLFTHGDQLGGMSIHQYIAYEGEPLQWLIEKCGNRFHVFNNKAKDDFTQVAELLEKIDEMVTGNHGSHFELDKESVSLISEKQREYEESKSKREQQDCEYLKLMTEVDQKLKEQRIVLIGHDTTNETADTILGSDDSDPQSNLQSVIREATVARWQVTVVVTPGWVRDSSQTSERDKREIVRGVCLCSPGPHAFLLVIPACTTFTVADETAINERLKLLGENVWNHIIVVFTRASWMGDTPIELYITSEGEPLITILNKCGNRYHVISNVKDDQSEKIQTLLEKIEVMVAGNRPFVLEDMADEGLEDESEDDTGATFQLPTDDVLGQRGRKPKAVSTIAGSSGYGSAALSECGSAKLRPDF